MSDRSGPAEGDANERAVQGAWPRLRGRLFHLYFTVRRPMTLGVRGLVHDAERDAVFLIRHTYVPGWQLPGGGVERGETMETALRRELLEEGNIEIEGAPELRSMHFNRRASARDHVGVYLVRTWRQPAPKRPDREIADSGFFPLDALPPDTGAATRQRIAECLRGAAVSPYW